MSKSYDPLHNVDHVTGVGFQGATGVRNRRNVDREIDQLR